MKVFVSFSIRSLVVVLFISSLLFVPASTEAQGQPVAGIGISPATIEEGANPGETKRYTVTVANLSDSEQTYYVYVRDIVGVNGSGVPEYASESAEVTGFELSKWITLDSDQITVPAATEVPLGFTMQVPENAAPGSHFGAVFLSVEPPRLRSTGAAVGYEVANIISIRVAGDALEKAEIRQFSTDKFLYGTTSVNFSLRIENLGNVLVRPIGPIEITNMFGKQVAVLTFNESLAGVFPKVVREFTFRWEDDGIGFGRYEARVSPVYGGAGGKTTMSSTVSFWILPMNIIGPAVGVLVVLLLLVYFGVRLYVRRTMALMGVSNDRRIVRSRRSGSPVMLMTFVAMCATTILFLLVLLILFA